MNPMVGTTILDLPLLPPLDARIPKWSLNNCATRKCPLCRKDNESLLLRPDRLPVAHCADCHLWYVSRLPPADEILKFYQGYWFSFRPKDLSQRYATSLLSGKDPLRGDIRLNRLSVLAGGLEGRRLLEVGCGAGELLVAAKHRGATVFANDVSNEACTFVGEQLGIPVFQGELSDSRFTHQFGQMDIIVMSDLIEHPVEPIATLEAALNILRPGGLLLLLTPNGSAAGDNVHSATRWVGFRVDLEHLQYLSTGTISVLAGRYYCQIEHLETLGYPGLDGIDRPPALVGSANRSLKGTIKSQLKKSKIAVKLVLALRAAVATGKEAGELPGAVGLPHDPRCGDYHLVTVLRKK
jgi:2-polyprenyl-3-methyl-5-hydroxy-6-metoxy-1,4-benzoquinol methylase